MLLGTGLVLAASASPAEAAVTLGQLDPGGTSMACGVNFDRLQPAVTSGNSYVASETGTITSWTTNASLAGGQQLTMKVFRKVGDPSSYQVVGHSGPQTLTPGGTAGNTFPANVSVKSGDVLGLYSDTNGSGCFFTSAGNAVLYNPGNLDDGASALFLAQDDSRLLNITAVLNPSNSLTVGATTPNKKKGTATLNISVPNPGDLTASGNGVQASSAARAVISKSVSAGSAQLLIKAKGKKRKTLNQTGKVKLNVTITYTPANGDPGAQSVTVKLKKKL